jgi:class 3 adenylate cyclase
MNNKLVKVVAEKLTERGVKPDAIEAWKRVLSVRTEQELYRINVYHWAEELGVAEPETLEHAMALTRGGVFDLHWEYRCPHCSGISARHTHLSDSRSENFCQLCQVSFRNELDSNVEVTFSPSGRYYTFSQKFETEYRNEMMEAIRAGQYHPPERFVSGLDCLHIQEFRDLFLEDAPPVTESLSIRNVTLMFTDIKGSTELYDLLGDAAAYKIVREHFEILFEKIGESGGIIVKTIGDAVMASFLRPVDAVRTAWYVHEAFIEFNRVADLRSPVLLKIGIHGGPALMVNLNERLDYFGGTVNITARVQGLAKGDEIYITEYVRQDPDAVRFLGSVIRKLGRGNAHLKGIQGSRRVYKLMY